MFVVYIVLYFCSVIELVLFKLLNSLNIFASGLVIKHTLDSWPHSLTISSRSYI